jgi:hypothetical protein
MVNTIIWGILFSAFIVDLLRSQMAKEQSTSEEHIEHIDTPKFEGLKIKEGDNELNVKLDRPIHNPNDLINIRVQYW